MMKKLLAICCLSLLLGSCSSILQNDLPLFTATAEASDPPKKLCDCCKPKCTCEYGKLNDDCTCYPCKCFAKKDKKIVADGVKVGRTAAAADFKDIGFYTTSTGEHLAFIRLTNGKEINGDSLKGKDFVIVNDAGNIGEPVSVEKLHDWASQHVGTRVFVDETAVFFYADQKVARSKPQAAAPVFVFPQGCPTCPSCPTCPNGNCPIK